VASIRQAKSSIDLTYFIYDICGAVGGVLTEELGRAAKRGVRVRVIVDAYTQDSDFRDKAVAVFDALKIDVRYYNVTSKYNPMSNLRTHIKMFVFDGTSYHTGGRNIADDYFGLADGTNWIDRDVFVRGSSSRQADASFNELWNSSNVKRVESGFNAAQIKDALKSCTDEKKEMKSRLRARLNKEWSKPVLASSYRCEGRFVADSPAFADAFVVGTDQDNGSPLSYLRDGRLTLKRFSHEMLKMFSSAKAEIFTENWGYVPQEDVRQIFLSKRSAGIPVVIVTNRSTEGYGPTDLILRERSQTDSKGSMKVLAVAPELIVAPRNALTPKNSIGKFHSKIYVVDRKKVAVSSWNLDPRSHHTNLEAGWVSDNCPAFAAEIQDLTMKELKTKKAGTEKWEGRAPTILEKITAWASHEFL
jgi:putative cardiolipin synthase